MSATLLWAASFSFFTTIAASLLILCAGRHWPLRAKGDGRPAAGLAVAVGVLAGSLPFLREIPLPLILGGTVILLVGLLDDRFDLSPWQKLLGQGIAAALVAVALPQARLSFLGFAVPLGAAEWIVPFLWVLTLTNAVNLIDGLDGLAVTMLLSPMAVLLVVVAREGSALGGVVAAATLGALLGFLPLNGHRGRVLLGDTGAELLGYLLSVLTLGLLGSAGGGFPVLAALLLAGVPVADTTFAVVRRLVRRRSILRGDEGHIHHRLARRVGVSSAVLLLAGTSLLAAVAALLLLWIGR